MEINEIQDLIKFVAKSGVSEVELETEGFKIVIKTGASPKGKNDQPTYIQAMPMATQMPQMQQQQQAAPAPQQQAQPAAPAAPAPKAASDDSKYVTIKSPMIGTFYRSPGPDKGAFVNIGDEIKTGKVICIIEAMKLFNEIESEVSGKIVKVLVDDASPVEYDQPLFLVDPS